MSADFILEYAGKPIAIVNGETKMVTEREADHFGAEADAWMAAYRADLNPAHCRVINLYDRYQAAAKPPTAAAT